MSDTEDNIIELKKPPEENFEPAWALHAQRDPVWAAKQIHGLLMRALDVEKASKVDDDLISGLQDMLRRIAAVDGVEFDPRCEENIADGVHALSDHAGAMEAEVERLTELIESLRDAQEHDQAEIKLGHQIIGLQALAPVEEGEPMQAVVIKPAWDEVLNGGGTVKFFTFIRGTLIDFVVTKRADEG